MVKKKQTTSAKKKASAGSAKKTASQSTMKTPPSPEGLDLGGGCIVGKKIGEGAQGVVHLLTVPGSDTAYAVKLVPVQPHTTNKRKLATEPYCHERALHKESMLYANQLPDLQGTDLPRLFRKTTDMNKRAPSLAKDKAHGWHYLIMELLPEPLWDAILECPPSQFAAVAQRLFSMVHTLHKKELLLVDCKTDNFLLAPKGSKKNSTTIANRIRLVDLGQVQPFAFRKPDQGDGSVEGTPLYASLHVHNGHTPSRRDDCFAMLLVIMELLARLYAEKLGTTAQYYDQSKGIYTYLPWAAEESDDALGKVKEQQLLDPKSDLWKRLPANVASVFKECLELCHSCDYTATPPYARLMDLLGQVSFTVPKKRKASTTPKKKASSSQKKKQPRSTTRFCMTDDSSDEDDESPPKKQKTSPDESDDDVSMEDASADGSGRGITLTVKKGPHLGTVVHLLHGRDTVLTVGKNPRSKTTGESVLALDQDDELADSHCTLALQHHRSGDFYTLKVTTIGKNVTKFNDNPIKSKELQVHCNNTISFGKTSVLVDYYVPASASKPKSLPKKKKQSTGRRARAKKDDSAPMDVDDDESAPSPDENRQPCLGGMTLTCSEGPHLADVFTLLQGQNEVVIVGSKPSSKTGETLLKLDDDELNPSHVKLELDYNVKGAFFTLLVTPIGKSVVAVNDMPITAKQLKAFGGQTLKLGRTKVKLSPYIGSSAATPTASNTKKASTKKRTASSASKSSTPSRTTRSSAKKKAALDDAMDIN